MKRPVRINKQSKVIDRLLKEGQCRDCSVVVTRMDFAKILGKFTKVKIQYESNSAKEKQKALREVSSPNSNTRLKSNENGMVLIHRSAYKEHPVKEVASPRRQNIEAKAPSKVQINSKQKTLNNNILKENNRLKKTPIIKDKIVKGNVKRKNDFKKYGIIFTNPKKTSNEIKNEITLFDLLPSIDKDILPSADWSIDYLPHTEEPKEDKVYDKIAAELEDLMYNEKSIITPTEKLDVSNNKDDFPSILDILNEKPSDSNLTKTVDQINSAELKLQSNSNDVEAMLLGDTDLKPVNNLIETSLLEPTSHNIEEPGSPSILDEALQKGIAEQLPEKVPDEKGQPIKHNATSEEVKCEAMETEDKPLTKIQPPITEIEVKGPAREITHLVFKHMRNGSCSKSVTCPKTLKYKIELSGKPVELLGAPKFVSSTEDLQVLLQIVNESELESVYVLQ